MDTTTYDPMQVVTNQLQADFANKHQECEKSAYALACHLEVGRDREIAFNLYEIIRTAPREARKP